MPPSRTPGRPTQTVLDQGIIARAALELATEAGYEKLTMSRLAKTLGTAPSALYNHVRDKSHLLLLLQEEVVGHIDTAPLRQALDDDISAHDALEAWAESYRDVFAAHIPLIGVLAVTPIARSPRTQKMYNLVAEVMLHAGVPADEALGRIIAIESFIFGSAMDYGAPENIFDPAPDDETSRISHLEQVVTAMKEREATGAANAPAGKNPYTDAPFKRGLALLLGGF